VERAQPFLVSKSSNSKGQRFLMKLAWLGSLALFAGCRQASSIAVPANPLAGCENSDLKNTLGYGITVSSMFL
jgi:hypothetical protein